ncbi:MAG: restriction endonuclease [Halomonas sp.]|nr:restriction endonuclease [Halomonas sp.]
MRFRIGEFYRYAKPADAKPSHVDGLPNFHFIMRTEGMPQIQMERGIAAPARTRAPDGDRVAAFFLSSSYNKRGSFENPWHDEIEPDRGYARYYGDNRTPGADPSRAPGNSSLLAQFELHASPDPEMRQKAAPLLIFRSSKKGYKEFCGLGILTGVQRVTQYAQRNGGFFTNYLFEIALLTLTEEDEGVAAIWLKDRRDLKLPAILANAAAPSAWLSWIRYGKPVIERLRRRVVRYQISPKSDQLPGSNTSERKALETIYKYYDGRKSRFEALASMVCESTVRESGGNYQRGWLTRGTSDGGLDFVGRIDVGDGFARTKLVVLGQAKCERIDAPTGGNHLARTVARLRRGWLGAYVTTSYFSPAVQKEVYEDQYPLILINGRQLAEEATRMQLTGGYPSLDKFLDFVDQSYEEQVNSRDPEEILWD